MSRPNSKINHEVYDKVKLLTGAGVKGSVIVGIIGVSTATVSYIKHSSSYEDYRNKVAQISQKNRERITKNNQTSDTPNQPESTSVYVHTDPNLVAEIKKLNQKIDEMLEAYKWVVEHAQVDYKKKNVWFR